MTDELTDYVKDWTESNDLSHTKTLLMLGKAALWKGKGAHREKTFPLVIVFSYRADTNLKSTGEVLLAENYIFPML